MKASTYPAWVFDNSPIDDPFGYGDRAVRFLRALKHPASTAQKKAFQLTNWQERIIRRIYGPRNPDGSMIVKTVLLFLPRGNRKTTLAAALALLHTIGPEAPRASKGQVIFAAKDSDQAQIGFEEASEIIKADPRIEARTRIYGAKTGKKLIECQEKNTTLRVLSSDGGKAHGLSPTFILMDELHEWQGRKLWSALKSSRVKKRPLTVICTTAGAGQENLLFDEYHEACKVARGEKLKPSYLPILFMADPGDDWEDEATWHKANPGLRDGFVSIEEFRDLAADARDRPQELFEFKQYNLNVWQAHSTAPLFNMKTYDASFNPHFDLADLEELPCYLGVDLSVNGDLTAIVGAWRHPDGKVSVHPWFFVPGEDLRTRAIRDSVPYEKWRDDKKITAIDGPIIEPDEVEAQIKEICARFDVREIAFDPHLAKHMMQHLHDEGMPAVEFRQTPLNMGVAYGTLERVVNGRKLTHGGHPILRHHFDSVVAVRTDDGRVKAIKGKKTDRKDGADAAAMAVSRAAANDNQPSMHELDPDEYAARMDRLWEEAEIAA
ncbi:terminase large subunit [Rhizobium sp. PL01]|uniref:terminase large subunit n=1 Tax=Rhizobium sp. PL01 TaxID=3085631 RepID=UPI0029815988|nr:terminase TerL endonuclease subunit [Rhizobium sp. PL01]MDW5314090.1 terminase TerL endonuclease subunit [Rhizobium sp. PL01]